MKKCFVMLLNTMLMLLALVIARPTAVQRDMPLPVPEKWVQVQKGAASYYADDFHGKQTASGETFNMHALTAAHPKLPFGTLVRVVNRWNGKSVIVRITDRGPFVHGRVIDLSKQAARLIGMTGIAPVLLQLQAQPTLSRI